MYDIIANLELLFMNSIIVAVLFGFNLRYWKSRLINPLSMIYIMVFLGSFLEIGAFLADGKPNLIWLNYFFNITYLSTIGIMAACMLGYCNEVFPKKIWKSRKEHHLFMIPVNIEIFLLITAPWSKLIFFIDRDGFYHRSGSFYLQLIPYFYLIVTTVLGLVYFAKAETKKDRSLYLAIALFAIPPFLLGGLQLLFKENTLDVLEFSITLSLIANYAVSQNNRITKDTLTQLHNREVLDGIIADKMKKERLGSNDHLFIMMCDMDGFKNINDTYGHVEGDHALITVADVLHQVAKQYKATATRFGGDEFVIIAEGDIWIPEKIISEISRKLLELSGSEKYELQMSIGYIRYQGKGSVMDLLKLADAELYKIKYEKKQSRINKAVSF